MALTAPVPGSIDTSDDAKSPPNGLAFVVASSAIACSLGSKVV